MTIIPSPRRTRLLTVTALGATVAASVLAATPALATGSLNLTYTDRAGDVQTMSTNRLPTTVRNSVDLRAVTYRTNTTKQTLTLIYRTPTVYTPAQSQTLGITQQFSTVILKGSTQFWVDSTNRSAKVTTTNNAGRTTTCTGGKSVANPTTDTVTQTIPLSCIDPTSGAFMSTTFLTTQSGPVFTDAGEWLTRAYRL